MTIRGERIPVRFRKELIMVRYWRFGIRMGQRECARAGPIRSIGRFAKALLIGLTLPTGGLQNERRHYGTVRPLFAGARSPFAAGVMVLDLSGMVLAEGVHEMKRPLAGRRAFYAMGQRSIAGGFPYRSYHYLTDLGWPDWAICSFFNGQFGWGYTK